MPSGLLERGLLRNAIAFDPERMDNLQALTKTDGRTDDVVAILKGIRPEMLDFDVGDMPLASAPQALGHKSARSASAVCAAWSAMAARRAARASTSPRTLAVGSVSASVAAAAASLAVVAAAGMETTRRWAMPWKMSEMTVLRKR